ncbi:MAG: hypothetical protein MJZ81_05325 [Bacteroidales bacterium]|nr:hypothetical protein [Bacteroidales bacterium]
MAKYSLFSFFSGRPLSLRPGMTARCIRHPQSVAQVQVTNATSTEKEFLEMLKNHTMINHQRCDTTPKYAEKHYPSATLARPYKVRTTTRSPSPQADAYLQKDIVKSTINAPFVLAYMPNSN